MFKNVIYKMCLQIMYLIYTYKEDLALNNLQWLMCHKTKSNQTQPVDLGFKKLDSNFKSVIPQLLM